jgi:hypothetical protein
MATYNKGIVNVGDPGEPLQAIILVGYLTSQTV